jgi:hypothetical protein
MRRLVLWSLWSSLSACDPASRAERCTGREDEDNDGLVDCGDPECARHCDTDGDGSRDARYPRGRDCDDEDPLVRPGATEICNGLDDDCDGLVDDEDPELDDSTRLDVFLDLDLDGYGAEPRRACAQLPASSLRGGDCDDSREDVWPGAEEVCNGLDDDCDGLVDAADDGVSGLEVVFLDEDGDGYGLSGEASYGCPGAGWALQPSDCDDTRATVHPGADEICDGLDTDCDALAGADEGDGDGDGDPVCSDCDDADDTRSSRIEERCNGLDDDCDGLVDTDDDTLNLFTCGYTCPEPDQDLVLAMDLHYETWNPCLLDEETTALCSTNPANPDTHIDGERLHRVAWSNDLDHWRDELFLFLPPGPGRENSRIRLWASYAGYRVVSLGYVNDATFELACEGEHSDECYRTILYETQYGVDLSALIEVSYPDSIDRRLSVLLAHLAREHPDMGFERYLTEDGRPYWPRIVATGWSGGGGQAAFLADYEEVSAAWLLSAPKDHRLDPIAPVDWVAAPGLTPGCRMMAAWHVDEPFSVPPEAILSRAWDEMGIPGTTFDLDENPGVIPPDGTYRVSQSVDIATLPMGCTAHSAVGSDICMREEMLPAYLYQICSLAELDLATCP